MNKNFNHFSLIYLLFIIVKNSGFLLYWEHGYSNSLPSKLRSHCSNPTIETLEKGANFILFIVQYSLRRRSRVFIIITFNISDTFF